MRIDRFQMERTQSLYENEVRWNLSESGVLPLRVEELLEGEAGRAGFLQTALKYPEANGSQLLRERIALFYPGASAGNVLVTTGTSEANYTTLWGLLEKGDRAAIMISVRSPGVGSGPGVRGEGRRLPARRKRDGRCAALGSRYGQPEEGGDTPDARRDGDQPEQPDRGGAGRKARWMRSWMRPGAWGPGSCPTRSIAEQRSATTRRPPSPTFWGTIPKGDRDFRIVEGVWPSGTSDRLDRRASRADGAVLGDTRTTRP